MKYFYEGKEVELVTGRRGKKQTKILVDGEQISIPTEELLLVEDEAEESSEADLTEDIQNADSQHRDIKDSEVLVEEMTTENVDVKEVEGEEDTVDLIDPIDSDKLYESVIKKSEIEASSEEEEVESTSEDDIVFEIKEISSTETGRSKTRRQLLNHLAVTPQTHLEKQSRGPNSVTTTRGARNQRLLYADTSGTSTQKRLSETRSPRSIRVGRKSTR